MAGVTYRAAFARDAVGTLFVSHLRVAGVDSGRGPGHRRPRSRTFRCRLPDELPARPASSDCSHRIADRHLTGAVRTPRRLHPVVRDPGDQLPTDVRPAPGL